MDIGGTVLGWVDIALVAVLLVSVAVGLWRGLVFEVLSLLGWVAAYVAAQLWAAEVALRLPVGTPGSGLNHAAAFALTFVGVLFAWALVARLLRMLIAASPLSAVDRVLGAGFGLLRGLLVLLAVATVVALTPARQSPAWQDSHGAIWLTSLLQGLRPVLPPDLAQHLPAPS